ncbi:integrase arm-type DNA-binding domain-containing protein [Pseudomonas chlororaphis]|uniref:tyrosine-type recombinase/integrase n=1 Tax=Pseudomonas chlororaphis TaxID=587753 RepID=UPI001B345440|nr:site-specific integrase [Pseudomonas chlororaphis]MBP5085335.1 integrase arm-type DNA-binding domain-containing protein [Pseudomonas chlororaphis]
MATTKKSLTDAAVRNLKSPGAHSDGTVRGLFLVVTPQGSKSWRLRYWIDKKEYVFTLGHYPETSLDSARKAATNAKGLIKQGIHPKDARQAEAAAKKAKQALTFEAVAEEFIQHMKAKDDWSTSTESGVRISLNASINPHLAAVPVSEVDVSHIKAVLSQPRLVGKRTAQKVALSVIKRVLGYAKVSKYVTTNNADGLDELLPKRKKGEARFKHHAALETKEELQDYLARLDANNRRTSSFYGLRLLTMLPVRPAELAQMRWEDLEPNPGFWVFTMSKVHRQHIVPLPRQALVILDELQSRRMGQAEYVLPGRLGADRHVHPDSFRIALTEQLGYAVGEVTPHGFRATFQTLARKHLRIDTMVLELCLGHETPAAFSGAYDRNEFLEERIEAAQKWADYLDELRAVPLNGAM